MTHSIIGPSKLSALYWSSLTLETNCSTFIPPLFYEYVFPLEMQPQSTTNPGRKIDGITLYKLQFE